MKQLRSDAVQTDKTPVYIIDYDSGESYYLIDAVSFNLLQYYMGHDNV